MNRTTKGFSFIEILLVVVIVGILSAIAIPALLSQFVSTIKETTLGYVINVPELTFAASQINNRLLTKPFEVFLILALIYYAVCFSLTQLVGLLERRIARRRLGPALHILVPVT